MVKVLFDNTPVNRPKNTNKITLQLSGHAGQADIGHDIVCASCSILAYTVAQLVKNAEALGDLKSPAKIKLENGDAYISCKPNDDAYETILGIFMFAEVGYKLLAHNYPQFVELTSFGAE